jgi:peptidoglycan/xylan/chitin deacetylase (PgdA/CDA1 family)
MGLKRRSVPAVPAADTRGSKRSLQWLAALVLLALPAVFLIFGDQWLNTYGPAANAEPAEVQVSPPQQDPAAAIDVPDYTPADPMPATPGQTVVSLTFDDGFRGQARAAEILSDAGLQGTFYLNSGNLGSPRYLTLKQAKEIALADHEIGGHTLSHQDIQDLGFQEAAREICQDRVNLDGWGFDATNFAFPFASSTPELESLVRECGYNSARGLGDTAGEGCEDCPETESLRPADPYLLKAPEQVEADWTLQDLQDKVTRAEDNGGWVILTFHGMCPFECTSIDVEEGLFTEFVDWLAQRSAPADPATANDAGNGPSAVAPDSVSVASAGSSTVVRTVQQVIGGPNREPAEVPAPEPPAAGENALVNGDLNQWQRDATPFCWVEGGYGDNRAEFSRSRGPDGSNAAELVVSDYIDGDAKLITLQDLGECAPAVEPGHRYSLRADYKTETNAQFSVYYRDGQGAWHYWTASPYLDPAQDFVHAEWTTPPVPAYATALTFGIGLIGDGTLVTDNYELYAADGAPPAHSPAARSSAQQPSAEPSAQQPARSSPEQAP